MNAVSTIYTTFLTLVALAVIELVLFPVLTAIFVQSWQHEVALQEARQNSFTGIYHDDDDDAGGSKSTTASAARGAKNGPERGVSCVQFGRAIQRSFAGLLPSATSGRKTLSDTEWLRLYRKWRGDRTNDQRTFLTLDDVRARRGWLKS